MNTAIPGATKTIVITGSTRGLGLATALQCLRRGANVVISSENESELRQVLDGFRTDHPQLAGRVCDVSRREQVEGLMAFALERFGAVDVWINNAGVSTPTGGVVGVPLALGEAVININIRGVYYGSVLAARHFERQGRGRLINIVGRGEKKPVATANMYASSKAWIRNFTLAMRKENRVSGIEYGVFNPGFIVTRLSTKVRVLQGYESVANGLRKIVPLLGANADDAARELAELVLAARPLPATRSRERLGVVLPLLIRRLVLRQAPPCDMDDIQIEVVAAE